MLLPSATKRRLSQIALVAALFCVSLLASPLPATGQSVEEIKKAREDLLRDSADLDKEIEVQRQKLLETSGQAKTLDGAVRTLDASVKKIDTSIKKTEVGIKTHELTILTLAESIAKNRAQAARDRAAVTRLLGSMDATQAESGLERILVADELGAVWESLDAASSVRDQLRATAATLEAVTEQLSAEELAERVEKERLSQARKALSGERESAATAKAEKAELLAETRNQEAEYQRILNEKLAQKEKFEAALREFEEQLQIAIDPDGYPKPRRGILAWPLREPIRITQLFGGTAFAKQHASAYGRPFHPGVDIGGRANQGGARWHDRGNRQHRRGARLRLLGQVGTGEARQRPLHALRPYVWLRRRGRRHGFNWADHRLRRRDRLRHRAAPPHHRLRHPGRLRAPVRGVQDANGLLGCHHSRSAARGLPRPDGLPS